MRNLCAIIILFGFTIVSALAGADSHLKATKDRSVAQIAQSQAGYDNQDLLSAIEVVDASNESGKECPCKHKEGPASLVCGVTLALQNSAQPLRSLSPSETLDALSVASIAPEFIDRQKRPPRTIL